MTKPRIKSLWARMHKEKMQLRLRGKEGRVNRGYTRFLMEVRIHDNLGLKEAAALVRYLRDNAYDAEDAWELYKEYNHGSM